MSLSKTYHVTERIRLQLWAEAQNILNHPSWGLPNVTPSSTTFGTIGAPGGSRTMTFRGLINC